MANSLGGVASVLFGWFVMFALDVVGPVGVACDHAGVVQCGEGRLWNEWVIR